MGTVVGEWRIRFIIFLVVSLTCLYITNSFFYGVETDESGFIVDETTTDSYGDEEAGKESSQSFVSILFTAGNYLTFGNIDNVYARIIINIFTTVCWIVIGYILYTFVKEWVPFT